MHFPFLLSTVVFSTTLLPAHSGVLQYQSGDPAPSFNVSLLDERPLIYNANTQTSASWLPLLILETDLDDGSVGYMEHMVNSIDGLLDNGPSGAHFLFVSVGGSLGLEVLLHQRLALTTPIVQAAWSGRLHFALEAPAPLFDLLGKPVKDDGGQFVAIDANGWLAEVRWEKYATLKMLTLEAQRLEYDKLLHERLAKPAHVVPIFNGRSQSTVAEIRMPPRSFMQSFDGMSLDFALSCAGNIDRDCMVWDRIISLSVQCDDSSDAFELGRWITPFPGRSGRWLTRSPLIPLLGDGNLCTFSVNLGVNDPWIVSLNLRFENFESARKVTSVLPLKYPNPTEYFKDSSYNLNRTVSFSVKDGTSHVEIISFITSHSGCELWPTSHHFIVNDNSDFNTLKPKCFDCFMEASSDYESAAEFRRRTTDVVPLVWDITAAVNLTPVKENTLRYQAFSYTVGKPHEPNESGCGGNIRQSSYLVFYNAESERFVA